MRYRLRTIMLVIAGLAPPIYAGCDGWKAGCLFRVLLAWILFVAAPLFAMVFALSVTKSEAKRETIIGVQGALAVIGYLISILLSVISIGFASPWIR